MKHIIEKHVKTILIPAAPTHVVVETTAIPIKDFPALISDLEAEWCKAMEWSEANYGHITNGKWVKWEGEDSTEYTTAELLKIYQNKEK